MNSSLFLLLLLLSSFSLFSFIHSLERFVFRSQLMRLFLNVISLYLRPLSGAKFYHHSSEYDVQMIPPHSIMLTVMSDTYNLVTELIAYFPSLCLFIVFFYLYLFSRFFFHPDLIVHFNSVRHSNIPFPRQKNKRLFSNKSKKRWTDFIKSSPGQCTALCQQPCE